MRTVFLSLAVLIFFSCRSGLDNQSAMKADSMEVSINQNNIMNAIIKFRLMDTNGIAPNPEQWIENKLIFKSKTGDKFILVIQFNDNRMFSKNCIVLADSTAKILDMHYFDAALYNITTQYVESVYFMQKKDGFLLNYIIAYSKPSGMKYLDSLEQDYIKNNPKQGTPAGGWYGFESIPERFIDTIISVKNVYVSNNKIVL